MKISNPVEGYDPIALAEKLRPKMIDLANEKVLFSRLSGSLQAPDITVHTKIADDFFRAKVYTKQDERKLDPFRGEPAAVAAKKLTLPKKNILVAPEDCNSTFLGQINGCNLRCWYCYVDSANLNANPQCGQFFSAEEILIRFLTWSKKTQNSANSDEKLNILRLSGGEVFLVPEIIVWTIEVVEKFGLQDFIYLWVDCNLATGDFYWKYLTREQREKIRNFRNIGFCGCYKGFDRETFYKNTSAKPEFFDEQFKMHKKLIDEGLDIYTYLYPVATSSRDLRKRLALFIDKLQREVNLYVPLRMATPIIKIYGPTEKRLTPERKNALENQWEAMKIWKEEMKKRFTPQELALKPHEVPIRNQ